ncbi:uncharacterized protein LOC117060529 [Lacerta agilis]|uniref:uncharacterized protein LOC117060529 n=1 Tax=Lacerta agilis TaxID=80427 RepID=UPI0014191CB7|nr:uncharacterized protein LOC117060529 [Lacerta agilis]
MDFVQLPRPEFPACQDPAKEEGGKDVVAQTSLQGQVEKTTSDVTTPVKTHEAVADAVASDKPVPGVGNGRCSPTRPGTEETNSLNSFPLEGGGKSGNGANVQEGTVPCSAQDNVDFNNLVLSQSTSFIKFGSSTSGHESETILLGSGDPAGETELVCSHNGLNPNVQVSGAIRKGSRKEEEPGHTTELLTPEAPKEAVKENKEPSIDSLVDMSQEKSFSEEPVTDSSCSAAVPPEQALADKEGQRGSSKRKKKKRHSKSNPSGAARQKK